MIQHDHALVPPANPGASGQVTVYDTGDVTTSQIATGVAVRFRKRCRVSVYTNVADLKLRVEWAAPNGGTLRLFQADVTIPATTYFQRDLRLQPGRTKISLVSTTAPSTFDVAADLIDDEALSQ